MRTTTNVHIVLVALVFCGNLLIADTNDLAKTTLVGQYHFFDYCWASDSSFLATERYYNPPDQPWFRVVRVIEVYLDGNETEIARDSSYLGGAEKGRIGWPTLLPNGIAGYYRESASPAVAKSFVALEPERLLAKPSAHLGLRATIIKDSNQGLMEWTLGDIWLINAFGEPIKQLTMGHSFCLPKLSPAGDLVLASAAGGGIAVLDTLGNIIWRPVESATKLPNGHVVAAGWEVWSPDGRHVAYSMSEEDGHTGYGGDVYIATLADKSIRRITNTPQIEEINITWFPHGRKILYETLDGSLHCVEVNIQ